jgi:hypothetical protein
VFSALPQSGSIPLGPHSLAGIVMPAYLQSSPPTRPTYAFLLK